MLNGSSTINTEPMKPSSHELPGVGSGLTLRLNQMICKDQIPTLVAMLENDPHQFAMLWHAASRLGVPWEKYRGARVESAERNNDG